MEQIRRAKGHVLRSGFHSRLESICRASAEKIAATLAVLEEQVSIREVLRSKDVEGDLKIALTELMVLLPRLWVVMARGLACGTSRMVTSLMFGSPGGF